VRPDKVDCAWCGAAITLKARGRVPTWCSDNCRHRAWEQKRAAESGRSAITLVEREVTVEIERVVERVREVPVTTSIRNDDWANLLRQLSRELDTGHLYDRALPDVAAAFNDLYDSLERRLRVHS
jgi:hypothetical protein